MSGTTNDELPRGTPLMTVHGRRRGHVESLLGAGGQGAVYAVAIEGTRFALKWYHDDIASIDRTLRARLSRAIGIGPPTDRFLWPIDLVEIAGSNSFGYVMPLRDGDYNGMRDLIARPPKRIDLPLGRRIMVCLRIAQNFLELHARGFCYQDINFGNIFFHSTTGDILICDNDNVDIDGMDAAVFGTRKFMAPEVVRRDSIFRVSILREQELNRADRVFATSFPISSAAVADEQLSPNPQGRCRRKAATSRCLCR